MSVRCQGPLRLGMEVKAVLESAPDDVKVYHVVWFHESDFFEHIFTTPIRPVSQRRRLFSFGRWVLVKRNKPHGP